MGKTLGYALLLAISAGGVLIVIGAAFPNTPAKKRALLKGLGANTRIESIEIVGRGDDLPFPFGEPYRADAAVFRIKGHPDSRIIVAGPDPDICTGTDHLYLDSIGPYSLSEVCFHSDGVGSTAAVDIGAGGHGPVPPFRIASVDDLIDHYDDLIAYLADQPSTQTFRSRSDGEEWTRTINRTRGGTGRRHRRFATAPSTHPVQTAHPQR